MAKGYGLRAMGGAQDMDVHSAHGRAGVRGGAVGASACNLIALRVLLVGRVPLDRAQ